ncbi:MAG: YcxB family protein [Armatimonas sp.]
MTIQFESKKEDMAKYLLYVNDRAKVNRFIYLLRYVLIAIVVYQSISPLVDYLQTHQLKTLIELIINAIIIYVLAVFRKFSVYLSMKSAVDKTRLGHLEYSVTPEGMVSVSRFGRSLLLWSGIESVVEAKEFFAFHFSAAHAFFIPKHAFSSAEQGAEFLRLVEQYRREATGEPIPQTTKGAWWTQGESVLETPQTNQAGRN